MALCVNNYFRGEMAAYYNEIDPYAAQWLRNLIDVDERSIVDVKPRDLAGYAQCHLFAGIGLKVLKLSVDKSRNAI